MSETIDSFFVAVRMRWVQLARMHRVRSLSNLWEACFLERIVFAVGRSHCVCSAEVLNFPPVWRSKTEPARFRYASFRSILLYSALVMLASVCVCHCVMSSFPLFGDVL